MPIEDHRSVARLTLGASGLFLIVFVADWPLGMVGVVFAVLFLQAPAAPGFAQIMSLAGTGWACLGGGWLLFGALAAHKPAFLIALVLGIALSFAWSLAGAGLLQGILALMGALMMSNIVLTSPGIAGALVLWIPLNLAIAGLTANALFALIPPPPPDPRHRAKPPEAEPHIDINRRLLRMTLVTAPFAIAIFFMGSNAILALFFVAILAQQLAARPEIRGAAARSLLMANLIGAFAAILAYEITAAAPILPVPVVICVLACLVFGSLAQSGSAFSASAGSALTTMLIIFGGTLAPFADEADFKSVARVAQVAGAAIFVILAYRVVDILLPERASHAMPAK